MKYIIILFLVISFGCTNKNEPSKLLNETNNEQTISFISQSELIITGSFDFGSVPQNTTISKFVTYKNNSSSPGKLQPDLSNLFKTNGLFSINYATSDCFTGSSYKILGPGKTCQIEIILQTTKSEGFFSFGIPFYDQLNGNSLVTTSSVSAIIQTPTNLTTSTIKPCITNYHKDPITNKCVSNYKDCTSTISQATSATKHWDVNTSSWGSCMINSCATNYNPINNASICALTNQTRSCTIQPLHSTLGTETTADGGTTWSSCSNYICDNGYSQSSNNTCEIPPILTNNQLNLISNGSAITLLGDCEGNLPITVSEINNTQINTTCINNLYNITFPVSNGISGIKTIELSESKNGVTSIINVSYTLDKINPSLNFNTLVNSDISNNTNYTLSGSCSSEDSNQFINLTFTDSMQTQINTTAVCILPFWSKSLDLSSLSDGSISITATLTDTATNSTTINGTIIKTSASALYTIPTKEYMLIPQNLPSFNSIAYNSIAVSASGQLVKTNGTNIYIGTTMGLSISNDGGLTWTTKTTANGLASNNILDLAVSGNNIYVATYKGLSISNDGGLTWIPNQFIGSRIDSVAASGSNAYVSFANTIRYSRNNGASFSTYSGTTFSATESRFVNGSKVRAFGSNVYLIGNNSYSIGMSVSSDNGNTFTHLYNGSNYLDLFSDGSVSYALTASGYLAYSLNNFTTLAGTINSTSPFTSSSGNSQIFVNGNDIFCLMGGSLKISHNFGGTWSSMDSILNTTNSSSYGFATIGSNIIVYTTNGIARSVNNGYGFTLQSATQSITNSIIGKMNYFKNKLYFISSNMLFMSPDQGVSFQTISTGQNSATLQDITSSDSSLYIATSLGLLTSTDGISFSLKNASGSINTIKYRNNKLYTIISGRIHSSTNEGSSWASLNNTASEGASLGSFDISGSNISAINSTGYYIYSTDNGVTFNYGVGSAVDNTYVPIAINGSKVFIATQTNGIKISDINGSNLISKTTTNGLGSNITKDILIQNGTIYVPTNGGLSISTDNGTSFNNKARVPNGLSGMQGNGRATSVSISPSSIFVGTENGLSISSDAGSTFKNISTSSQIIPNDVQKVAVKGSNIYTIKNYRLYISKDNGKSFTDADWLNNYTSTFGVYDVNLIDNEIYIAGYKSGTGNGLFLVQPDGASVQRVINLDSFYPVAINYFTKNNGKYYFATNKGILIYNEADSSMTQKTTVHGLGSDTVNHVSISGSYIFAATANGLSISIDSGSSFNNKTTTNGLPSNTINGVAYMNNQIFAATANGLSISSNFTGNLLLISFTNKTTTDGLPSNTINYIQQYNTNLYISTALGLSITTDGLIFTNKGILDGFGSNSAGTSNILYKSSISDQNELYFATDGGIIKKK